MRPKKTISLDLKRGVYRGRFHSIATPSGEVVKRDLMSIEQAQWQFLASGKRSRRGDAERNRLLEDRYGEILRELLTAQAEVEAEGETRPLTLSEGVQEWLDELSALRDPQTVKHYSLSASLMLESAGDFALNQVPRGLGGKFAEFLGSRGNSDATINSRMRVLQGFFRWAFRTGLLAREIRLPGVRQVRKAPGILSPEQMQAVLSRIEHSLVSATSEGLRVSALNQRRAWWLLRFTGMRGGEVRALPLSNIVGGRVLIRDVPDAGFRVKGRREAALPIAPALQEFLDHDLSGRGPHERWYLDSGTGALQWSDTGTMSKPFSRHFKSLGISGVKPLHGFRASVATHLLNSGASPVAVQALLRHSSIQTTMGYHNTSELDLSRLLASHL